MSQGGSVVDLDERPCAGGAERVVQPPPSGQGSPLLHSGHPYGHLQERFLWSYLITCKKRQGREGGR